MTTNHDYLYGTAGASRTELEHLTLPHPDDDYRKDWGSGKPEE